MDINQASTFLAGSILTGLGFVIIIIAAVAINNILHKYWKPVTVFTTDSWKGFNPPSPMIEPKLDKDTK